MKAAEIGRSADEIEELRARLAEAEEALRALRVGEVDALVVHGEDGPQVYTLKSAVEPYRELVEQMGQRALTVSRDGLILFCNDAFASLLDRPRERLVGTRLLEYAAPGSAGRLVELLERDRETSLELALENRAGEIVEVYASLTRLSVDDGQVRCLVVTDLSQQELRLRHTAVVEATNDIIYTLDPELVVQTWNRGAQALTGLSHAQAVGRSEWDLCPPEARTELEQLVDLVGQRGAAVSIDTVRYCADGAKVDLIYTLTPLRGRAGRLTGYSVVAHDITQRKEAEKRLRFLTAEIDHRAKNLLATVQAIAKLSARGAAGLEDFFDAFMARIQALAASHALLSAQEWRGARLKDIVGAALASFDGDSRIRVEGGAVILMPRAAQDLAISLHELATNAVKYGALSVPHGVVELRWWQEDERMVIDWRELNGPKVAPPQRQGLGSRVIRQTAGSDGWVDYAFHPEGVRCRFGLSDCIVESAAAGG